MNDYWNPSGKTVVPSGWAGDKQGPRVRLGHQDRDETDDFAAPSVHGRWRK